jgi:hypothetical protein
MAEAGAVSSPSFETRLAEQLEAVLFSEGESQYPNSPELSSADYLSKNLDGALISLNHGSATYDDYLICDDRYVDKYGSGIVPKGLRLSVVMPDTFALDAAGLVYPARKKLSATVVLEGEGSRVVSTYDFFHLNPDSFAARVPDMGRICKLMTLEGVIPQSSDYMIASGIEIIANPNEHEGLVMLQEALPVDIERHNAKRALLNQKLGLNVQAYAQL